MRVGSADRERVLAFLWLFGAALTLLTLVLPYDVPVDERARAAVAALAGAVGIGLLFAPPLADRTLHGLLAVGTAAIAYCCSLGVPDVEGVMFLLPVLYAFATFRILAALPHLALASGAYALVLWSGDRTEMVAPVVAWVFVSGVAAMLAFAVAALVELRERERAAGQRDRRIAEALQHALLPDRLPAPAGAVLAARYLPAAREADVGGDFYDALELADGRLALAIGDVAGKGLTAAAVVGRVRAAWRAYALEDPDPATVLGRLDVFLSVESGGAQMTTMLYALADLRAGTVTWASAGHLPPLLIGADGDPRFLTVLVGAPLGVVASAARRVGHAPAGPGDALLLYTDGLVERRQESIDEGLERLRGVLAGAPAGAEAVLDRALGALPRRLGDDAAALAVHIVPSRERVA